MGDISRLEKVFQLVEKSALSDEAKQSFALRRLQLMEEYSPSLIKLVTTDCIVYHNWGTLVFLNFGLNSDLKGFHEIIYDRDTQHCNH